MTPEKEKAYTKKEIETVTKICGSPPQGWYYDDYQAGISLLSGKSTKTWMSLYFETRIRRQMISILG
jgi:hypothetical protein